MTDDLRLKAGRARFRAQADGYAANSARDLPPVRLQKTPLVVSRWWFWTGVVVAAGAGLTYALVTERAPDRGDIAPGTAKLPLMRW